MKHLSLIGWAGLFALMTGTGALAGGEGKDFGSLDADGNGQLSQQEANARGDLSQAWSSVDGNGDGVVDRAEFSAFEKIKTEEGMQKEKRY